MQVLCSIWCKILWKRIKYTWAKVYFDFLLSKRFLFDATIESFDHSSKKKELEVAVTFVTFGQNYDKNFRHIRLCLTKLLWILILVLFSLKSSQGTESVCHFCCNPASSDGFYCNRRLMDENPGAGDDGQGKNLAGDGEWHMVTGANTGSLTPDYARRAMVLI